jgi:RND family efflux transporter MFP subunit
MNRTALVLVLAGLAVAAAGCGKKEADKPPVKLTNITTASVIRKDLPVVESAVGSATSLSVAQALDPTQVRRGSFTIRLPFPEHVARQLRIGQAVKLTSFDEPGKTATATVQQIRPALDSTTQTMEVIAALPGGREWTAIGSVRGEVVVGVRRGALVVPEQAVVLRPAGAVAYVLEGEIVKERPLQTGLLRDGVMEITAGLKAGETVAVDGATLLSDGAQVRVMGAGTSPAAAKAAP